MSRARVPIKVTLPPKTCAGTVGVRDDTSLVEMLIDPNHLDVVFLVVSTNGGTRQFMDGLFRGKSHLGMDDLGIFGGNPILGNFHLRE